MRSCPSAGPPCFLDPELFHFNVITGDEPSIFVDQRTFLARLDAAGHAGVLAIPGTAIEVGTGGGIGVEHPIADDEVTAIFERKGEYLAGYQADWSGWLERCTSAGRRNRRPTSSPTLQEWWEPLLAACPTVREGIGAACLLRAGLWAPPRPVEVLIDFPAGDVRAYAGEPYGFRFDIDRSLVEKVVAERAVDWSNSLFLSCRFRRLAPRRVQRVRLQLLQVAVARADAPHRGGGDAQAAPADRDRAGHRARRLGDAAALPPPQRRPQRVRRGRRLRAGVHAARLALRPGDRQVPHQSPATSCASAPPGRRAD